MLAIIILYSRKTHILRGSIAYCWIIKYVMHWSNDLWQQVYSKNHNMHLMGLWHNNVFISWTTAHFGKQWIMQKSYLTLHLDSKRFKIDLLLPIRHSIQYSHININYKHQYKHNNILSWERRELEILWDLWANWKDIKDQQFKIATSYIRQWHVATSYAGVHFTNMD